ncbi:uncharacterized protein H6S33_011731 [Morchella sextelata]|uniref:uncharacterized protein n=1 Tax=Morchella sextelata TaxID=1174677 RepID=UPI001D04A4CA|nr:uncharacterized protein H6S33_011731 [Morchella sextelata]KAH0610204.1 hypothetical protein H6S33_011731 [Morchella sextelata]
MKGILFHILTTSSARYSPPSIDEMTGIDRITLFVKVHLARIMKSQVMYHAITMNTGMNTTIKAQFHLKIKNTIEKEAIPGR